MTRVGWSWWFAIQIIAVRVEAADKRIQPARRFPDLGQGLALKTPTLDAAPAVTGWIVALVPSAAARETENAKFQHVLIAADACRTCGGRGLDCYSVSVTETVR